MAASENPRVNKLIELEVSGRIKPEHQQELDTYRAQGVAPKKAAGAGTEGERKASAFLSRALGSNRSYEDTGLGPRNIVTQNLSDSFPNLSNTVINSDNRQVADSAQDEFIAASLRQDSGAAIPPDEMERQRRIYFPMPGDAPAVIEQKRQARLRAIDGLVQSAGSGITATQKEYLTRIQDDLRAAVTGDKPAGAVEGEATENVTGNTAEAAGAAIDKAIDKAVGIDPPSPTTPDGTQPDGSLRVTIKGPGMGGGDPRLKDPKFAAGLEAILNNPNATRDDIAAYWAANGGAPKNASMQGAPLSEERGKGDFQESSSALIRGATNTLTLGLDDEIAAGAKTLFDGGTMRDNLLAERATNRYDEEYNPGARIAGQVGAGFALPVGAARSAAALGGRAAAYGGGYGFGNTDGGLPERLGGALTGAAIGGATGAGLGLAGQGVAALNARRGAGNVEGRAVLEAGQRQGIDVMPADVGGPFVRGATAGAAQMPGSMIPVRNAAKRVTEQALGARDRIAGSVGVPVEIEAAGEAAKAGAGKYIETSGKQGSAFYTRAQRLAGDVRPVAQRAIDTLDANLAELSDTATTSAPVIAGLERLGLDLTNPSGLSVDALRRLRTNVRAEASTEGLRGTDYQRRASQVLDAISEDIAAALPSDKARAAFRTADTHWKERLDIIDDVLTPIIGKEGDKAGEQVIQALNSAAKGNSARLGAFVRSLPAEESATVRATIISQLGRASAGAQDDVGGAFSLPQFLTHWNQMQPGAKRALFDDQTRAALDDLAKVANGTKQAQRYTNTSNSAGSIAIGSLSTGATGLLSLATLGKVLAAQYAGGRLLASPAFARWLAKAPNAANPGAHVNALATVAAREPAIAQEVLGLQAQLKSASGAPR